MTELSSANTSKDSAAGHPEDGGTLSTQRSSVQSFWSYLHAEVDPAWCTAPLAAYCFMTGFIDAISFSAVFVWCGFQTGNFAQLALALARLFETNNSSTGSLQDSSFHIADRQALVSLLTFNLGAFLGRIGDRMGPHTRIWLVLGTFIQTLFTMAAAVTIWQSGSLSIADDRGDPSWSNALSYVCLAFMSASLGCQGILGKRLNTQFTTTIVLTTVWVELVTDPKLFYHERVKTRDHKLIAAFFLFLGAFASRAILATVGASGALGVGTGVRLLITLSWLFVPGKKAQKQAS
ncbi:hypothetical protein K435DRAFT_827097 [Dendrothele bispora CBS 962.96]|uniref:DUF1275 domain protein n=1 Tax=Dendrothele bispora (strain CBS 962.96) TaxID=1314807 RepID=A0A4S8ML24_DENBC|nr:hypothetical protein K435DRAFT_827097 [Dendrothele bispora CBS 962.96]